MFHLASAPAVNMSNEEGRVEELRAADGFAKKGFGREFEERFSSSPQTADCEFFSAYLDILEWISIVSSESFAKRFRVYYHDDGHY